MTIDFTPILQAIIALLATLITVKVIPWIKANITETQQSTLNTVIKMLVYAAEEIYSGVGRGDEKLMYVQTKLASKGYLIDVDAIKAAVKQMNIQLDSTPSPTDTVTK